MTATRIPRRSQTGAIDKAGWASVFLCIVLLVGLGCWFYGRSERARLRVIAHADVFRLAIGAKTYYLEHKTWPDPSRIFSNGTPLDPWHHPYIYDGIVNDQPRFHSIGKDGIDQHGAEGSDDIVSWR